MVSSGEYHRVGSASRLNARIDDIHPHNTNELQRITYAKSQYPPDRSNPGQKSNAFDTSMASPSRQHNCAVRVSHRYIITVAEFGRSRRPPSLGRCEFRFESRRSHRVWALPAEFGRSRQKQQVSMNFQPHTDHRNNFQLIFTCTQIGELIFN